MRKQLLFVATLLTTLVTNACGGGGTLPAGSVVNDPGGGGPPPTKLVNVKVTVTVPSPKEEERARPGYVSVNTKSLVIQLASVDGGGVTGVNPTTIETSAKSRGCKSGSGGTVCNGTASGSPGNDVFAVTTYQGPNATGSVLSVGTVKAKIGSGGGGVGISTLSLSLGGVIASLKLTLSPPSGKRGAPMKSDVSLEALDASGAEIVGPSDFANSVSLSVQGDNGGDFSLHAGSRSGSSLLIPKPTSDITLNYNGNRQASSVSIHGVVNAPDGIGTSANFALKGKQPPPPVGTIYVLNLGTNNGRSATVTEYDGKAKGNAKPVRTLALSSKLYARSIAVDANNNLYVGYVDNEFGFSPSSGLPDGGNQIATYAPGASGNAQPTSVLTADKKSETTIFPVYLAFDPSGELVTYGATSVDGSGGNDAVLTYSTGSSGATAPAHAWAYVSPTLYYGGPTGLAIDSKGNYYVNAALHSSLGPSYGLFVTPASDDGNPSVTPSRTIPWDTITKLVPGLTTNVALDSSGEPFVANNATQGSGSAVSCQGRVNVFAAGTTGGTTDDGPLHVLTLANIFTQNSECVSSRDPLVAYFPSIFLYGTTLFASDDFNDAIDAYPSGAHGIVKPSLTISGSETGLNAPIMLVVTQTTPNQ